jgi:hypothetical protein
MHLLRFDLLRQSENTYAYQVLKADKKIAKLSIDGAGTRTITKQPGCKLPTAERRLIAAFQPVT